MASNYPTSLDTFTNPSAGNTLDSPSHSLQHSDINDAVEALETKLGTGDSPAGSATAGYVLVAGTADTSWNQVGYEGITSGTATSGQVLTAQGGGTALWTTPDASGLTLISTTSFSAVASQSLNDVFTSTYDNYRILLSGTHSASGSVLLRLRVGGVDNSTASSYVSQLLVATSTTVTGARVTSDYANFGNFDTTLLNSVSIDIFRPALAEATGFSASSLRSTSGAYITNSVGTHNQTTAYDGFSLFPENGTMTGVVSVYGYRKS